MHLNAMKFKVLFANGDENEYKNTHDSVQNSIDYMRVCQQLRNVMVNEGYTPSEEQEKILQLLTSGRENDSPWGYTTPRHIKEQTNIEPGNVTYHLRQLNTAGWIQRVTRGFYRFEQDPRQGLDPDTISDNEQPD